MLMVVRRQSDDERDIEDDDESVDTCLLQSDGLPQLESKPDAAESDVALVPSDSLDFEDIEAPSWEWPAVELTLRNIVILLIKVVCFVPWCVAVGGAIVMCPSSLELVVFATGYQPSLCGIRRFAYWAECAMQHVAIFLAFIATLWWVNHSLGVLAMAGVVAGAVRAWGDFVLDRSVPLGEDDRQAIYLVYAHYGVRAASETLVLSKTDAGYLAMDKRQVPEEDSDTE